MENFDFNIVEFDIEVTKCEVYDNIDIEPHFVQGDVMAWKDFALLSQDMASTINSTMVIESAQARDNEWRIRFWGSEGQTSAVVRFTMILSPLSDSRKKLTKAINADWE